MARGSIVKRPSGNYAIVYYVDGKQKWETIGPSRREAERALTARKREVDTGTWREPSSETLAAYAERWLARRDPARVQAGRTRLAPSTFAEYRRALLTHIAPHLGERTLASLRTEDIDALIAALEADGKAPGTVRNIVVPLRKMLADAVRQGKLVANPAARADLPPAQDFVGKEIPREHTDAIRQPWSSWRRTIRSETNRTSFTSVSSTSRSARVCGSASFAALRWRDVDRDGALIRVERAYSRRELGGRRARPESGRSRSSRRSTRPYATSPPGPSSAASTRPTSSSSRRSAARRCTSRTSTARVWRPALEHAGLGELRYRFHDLRHTCVSRLVAAGADVKLVQAVAGHASPLITLKRYSHSAGLPHQRSGRPLRSGACRRLNRRVRYPAARRLAGSTERPIPARADSGGRERTITRPRRLCRTTVAQHCLYFCPEPHQQGSFRPGGHGIASPRRVSSAA